MATTGALSFPRSPGNHVAPRYRVGPWSLIGREAIPRTLPLAFLSADHFSSPFSWPRPPLYLTLSVIGTVVADPTNPTHTATDDQVSNYPFEIQQSGREEATHSGARLWLPPTEPGTHLFYASHSHLYPHHSHPQRCRPTHHPLTPAHATLYNPHHNEMSPGRPGSRLSRVL